ncbi:MAG: ParB/RepB/Spo0J family partition protein [Erysipelotrichaceae bacterium]|nr:ParB/RepB/Spo0J family partition protein [Erysipelotrichaceae bacterium]MBQ1512265.1 ParB/RepB/Spo0J family partition protein [Erysipelotrichaceae bacterium]MBQ5755983.1 ParB/RepB/Spo0J family partition protein [Erysipelotrichaceae bacterium]
MAENRLGRGLTELFGSNVDDLIEEIASGDRDKNILPISEIRPNPYQPRKNFDQDKLKELAESIREHGVFQPIIVRKAIDGYELIAGERRLRASKLAGKEDIPAIVVEFSDQEMMEISLLENIQREDLNAVEEAAAYSQLIEKIGYTQEELAKHIGKSRTHITNMLRLLRLPDDIKEKVRSGKLSYGQARTLLAAEDEEKMHELAERAVREGLSVRDLEKLVSEKPAEKKKKEVRRNPYYEDIRSRLEKQFGTGVEVKKNKMVIYYNSDEDLNRILEKMSGLDQSLHE